MKNKEKKNIINKLEQKMFHYMGLFDKIGTKAELYLAFLGYDKAQEKILNLNQYYYCKNCPSNENRFECSAGYTKEECQEANRELRYP